MPSAKAGSCATPRFMRLCAPASRLGSPHNPVGPSLASARARSSGLPAIANFCSTAAAPGIRNRAMSNASEPFTGFRPAAFEFFAGLRDNNEPEWFKPRKAVYDGEVLAPFRALITAVGAALGETGIPLSGDPQRSIFRIYRDVRFSPDKRLYKTHAGAVLTRSGSKRDPGLLYIHIEPGESMVGAGFWHPEPTILTRIRRAILADPDA